MEDLFTRLTNVAGQRIGRWTRVQDQSNSPVPYSRGSNGLVFAGGDNASIGERAYEAFGSVGTLFSIVTQIGQSFASVPWHLYRRTSVRDKSRRNEIMVHGFLTVWNRPNYFYTGQYFRRCCQQHLDLVGETVIILYKVGNVVLEMWPVRPDRVHPVKHPRKFLTGYIYLGPDGEEVPLELDQVIHIKMPNPGDPYRGMGPVQAVLNDIDAARYSAEWNKNFFINGAQPGGVIEIDYRMSDEEFEGFLARWRAQHQGVANAHRVALLENAKWTDTKFSMEDMQFVELRNLPRELIREAFAFPKPMLGTVDDVNRANSDAAKDIMAEQQTTPRLSMWKDSVDNFLLPMFANGKTLELDPEDPKPVNKEAANAERNSQWDAALKGIQAGFHPADVAEAVGLPEMRWVGIPQAGGVNPTETEETENRVIKAHAVRQDRHMRELVDFEPDRMYAELMNVGGR